jgi:hypothetical protein
MYVNWSPDHNRLLLTIVQGTTRQLYHPFTPAGTNENVGLQWATQPFWLKKVRTGKRVWHIYSTFRTLNATTQLEPFRRVLEGIKWN